MSVIEIVLLILGAVVLAAGYFLPTKKENGQKMDTTGAEEEIKELVEEQMQGARNKISDIVDETINYAMEKSERSMERVSNEKIMAVNEYSDTVLGEIHKNHEEVMFLYDMLMDKHENLKSTVAEANKTVTEVKQTLRDAEITAENVKEQIEETNTMMEANSMRESTQSVLANQSATANQVAVTNQTTILNQEGVQLANQEMKLEKETSLNTADIQLDDNPNKKNVSQNNESGENLDTNIKVVPKQVIEPIEFTPIKPPVVEIIGGPDVEGNPEAELAMLLQKNKPSTQKKRASKNEKVVSTKKKATKRVPDEIEVPNLDIEFSKGNNGPRNNNDKILELHQAGKSNMAIAKELGLGIGEVKLVIDLYEGMKG